MTYIAKTRSEEEKAALVHTIQDALKPADDASKRRVLGLIVNEVKGLGDGADKGVLQSESGIASF